MKNSNDTIGNRTRDLPACSAVPQPTAPSRTPILLFMLCKIILSKNNISVNEQHNKDVSPQNILLPILQIRSLHQPAHKHRVTIILVGSCIEEEKNIGASESGGPSNKSLLSFKVWFTTLHPFKQFGVNVGPLGISARTTRNIMSVFKAKCLSKEPCS